MSSGETNKQQYTTKHHQYSCTSSGGKLAGKPPGNLWNMSKPNWPAGLYWSFIESNRQASCFESTNISARIIWIIWKYRLARIMHLSNCSYRQNSTFFPCRLMTNINSNRAEVTK